MIFQQLIHKDVPNNYAYLVRAWANKKLIPSKIGTVGNIPEHFIYSIYKS